MDDEPRIGETTQVSPAHSTVDRVDVNGLGDERPFGATAVNATALGVDAEASPGLAAEVAGRHQVLEQRGRREARLAELEVQGALDRQRHVETDDVEQLERTHRLAAADLHRVVDVVGSRVVRLEHLDRVVEVREQQCVDDEACAVAAGDRVLADPLAQRAHRVDDLGDGLDGATTSTSFITGAGLKKCRPTTSTGRAGRRCNVDDRRQDVVVARIAPGLQISSSVSKIACLDRQLLDDGLDDQVAVGEVVERVVR